MHDDGSVHWVLSWEAELHQPPILTFSAPFGGLTPTVYRSSSGNQVFFAGYLFIDAPGANRSVQVPAKWVCEAYEERGLTALAQLAGGFVIAIWDRAEDILLLLRDAMGLVPCYYQRVGCRILVSSCSDALLHQSGITPTPNRAMLVEWICGITNPSQIEETFIAEIRRLPPAHWVRFSREGVGAPCRYWNPLPLGFSWEEGLDVRTISGKIGVATQRCMDVGADAIALSGGYDSVVTAAFAADVGRQEPLRALSLRFSGTLMDEGALQIRVAQQLGFNQILREIGGLADDGFVDRVLRHSESLPMPVVGLWQPMYSWLMEQACDQGLERVIFGTGGDEMFTVDTALALDLAKSGRFFELWRFLRAWQRTSPMHAIGVAKYILWGSVAKPTLRAAALKLSPAGFYEKRSTARVRQISALVSSSSLVEQVCDRMSAAAPSLDMPGYEGYVSILRDLVQSPLLMLELDQGAAWMARYGITGLYPYFDRDLVEVVLRAPAHLLYGNGHMKAPLRDIAEEKIPGFKKTDKKVDFGDVARELIRSSGRRSWTRLAGAQQLAAFGVLDADKADRFMKCFFDSGIGSTQVAWRIMSTEAWVRRPELCTTR